ncbi:hypothetical protein ACVWWO_003587 [Bradyrhizobium sp. F1.13.1]
MPKLEGHMVRRSYAGASGIIQIIPADMLIKAESATMAAMIQFRNAGAR